VNMFLPVKTGASSSPGICGRCRTKKYLSELKSDPNVPGLRVCRDCSDSLDPYRKTPRQPENIAVQNPRLDESLDD
jgi:hypothetical protein